MGEIWIGIHFVLGGGGDALHVIVGIPFVYNSNLVLGKSCAISIDEIA